MGRRRRVRRRGVLGRVQHDHDRRIVRRHRAPALRTFSGGEQKRLALEALLRSDFDVLLLDEPDNFLDVPGKRWLEAELRRAARPCCSSATTASCWRPRPPRWSPSRPPARGPTAAGSPPTTRPARRTSRRRAPLAVYEDERKARGDRRRDAPAGEDQRGLRPTAEGRREPPAPVPAANEAPELAREQKIDMRLGGARTGRRALVIGGWRSTG